MTSPTTFTWRLPMVGVQAEQHVIGNIDCPVCCHCGIGPDRCKCGGIIHVELDDEIQIGDDYGWAHSERCDRCGENFEAAEE